jgi:mannose-6-phosphate isomerase-like protein (cupin superfamily)
MSAPISVLLRSEQSDGRLAVIDEVVPADFAGPPLHVHPGFDEGFYVLEGVLTFQAGEEVWAAGPGELAFAPRGTPHTFANLSGAEARTLVICTPAGFERYFDRVAAELAGVDPPPEAFKPRPETLTVGLPISSTPGGPR